jgi:hypothetical protein
LVAAVFLATVALVAVVALAAVVVRLAVVAAFAGADFAAVALVAGVVFLAGAALATFPLATISRKAVPGRNAGTDVFFTFTVSPVLGLRAVRALRTRFSKEPKPVMATLSPLVTAPSTSLMKASSAAVAVFRSPSRAASASMSSALFTVFLSRHKHSWQKNPCVATNSPPPGTRWGRKTVC